MEPDKKRKETDRLNIFLEKHMDENDPKLYLYDLSRLERYLHVEPNTDEERSRWL